MTCLRQKFPCYRDETGHSFKASQESGSRVWAGRHGPVSLPLVTQAPATQLGDECAMQEKKAEEIPPRCTDTPIQISLLLLKSGIQGLWEWSNSLHRGFALSVSVKARQENDDRNGSSNHGQVHLLTLSANWTTVAW